MHFIFDLDGTLIDSHPDIHENLNRLLKAEGLSSLSLNKTKSFVGEGSRKLVERAFHYLSRPIESSVQLDDLTNKFITHYMNNLTNKTTIYPNVVKTLTDLQKSGHSLSICTNKPIKPTLAILKDLGLHDFFNIITGGDSYPERKPHPLPVLQTIEQEKMPAEECVMIGDSIYDISAGQAAEIRTVFVTYGYSQEGITTLHPTYIINDIHDILKIFQ